MIDVIAFDADDTLWHNEPLYAEAQQVLAQVLSPYMDPEEVDRALYATEAQNLPYYGYGIKSFALSMVETACQVTGGKIQGEQILEIIAAAKRMLSHPVRLLGRAEETLCELAKSHRLMVITKGDLLDQSAKLARSGVAHHFTYTEVVSDKTEQTYRDLMNKHQISAERFVMVGNSLKSDILPVAALGGQAVWIPYHLTWQHETVTPHQIGGLCYYELDDISQLPGLIKQLDGSQATPNAPDGS
jgi:putative hydrolase of the HAD superfamily